MPVANVFVLYVAVVIPVDATVDGVQPDPLQYSTATWSPDMDVVAVAISDENSDTVFPFENVSDAVAGACPLPVSSTASVAMRTAVLVAVPVIEYAPDGCDWQ